MGDRVWRTADRWPPAEAAPVEFYLHSKGRANTRRGDGRLSRQPPSDSEPADSFTADPSDPVPVCSIVGDVLGIFVHPGIEITHKCFSRSPHK